MQSKVHRSKSEEIFNLARRRSIEKLRRKSQNNGVLERITSEIQLPKIKEEKPKIKEEKPKIKEEKPKQEKPNFKGRSIKEIPKQSKPLRINREEDIKKYIPSEGYIEIEMDERRENSNKRFLPTISKEGILYPTRDGIEFMKIGEYEKRQKLMQLPFVKQLPLIKAFLKWKRSAREKRYERIAYLLNSQNSPDFVAKRTRVMSRVVELEGQNEWFVSQLTQKNNFEKELERFLILAEGKVRDQFLELVKILEQEDLAEGCIFKMAFFKFQEMKLEKLKSLFKAIE